MNPREQDNLSDSGSDVDDGRSIVARRRLIRFLAVVCAGVAALLLLECGVRLFAPQQTRYFDFGAFRRPDGSMKPGAEGLLTGVPVKINAYGQRGSAFDRVKKNGQFRICVIGDSLVFGFGVEDAKRYPTVLQEMLNDRSDGTRVEVIPFGAVGYTLSMYRERLLPKALEFDPDIVVLGFVLNDFGIPPQPHDGSKSKTNRTRDSSRVMEFARQASSWLQPRSHLVSLVRDRFRGYYAAKLMDKAELVRYWELTSMFPDSDAFRRRLAHTKRQLDDVATQCQRSGTTLVLCVTPLELQMSIDRVRFYRQYIPTLPDSCVDDIPQRKLEKYCRSNGIAFVDVTDAFRAQSSPVFLGRVANQRDLCHPNARGHRLIAEELAETILPLVNQSKN
jgi:lysophospholipase L1-like esterase